MRWRVALIYEIDAETRDEAYEHANDLNTQIEVEPHDVTYLETWTDPLDAKIGMSQLGQAP